MRFAARLLGFVVVGLALPFAFGNVAGRFGAMAGAGLAGLGVFWVWLWLPRAAHESFEAGKYVAAARRYRLLGVLATSAARERASLLSRSGCQAATGDAKGADAMLDRLDAGSLSPAERAVWLNNRACARLAENDAQAALPLVDEANALRPDVPALQHTRGMALLAVGRIDEAIAVLDGMRTGGELPAHLEAERCRDLAKAWTEKGQTAYAEDYRLRARALAR